MQFADFARRAAELEAEPGDHATVAGACRLLAEAGADLPTVVRFLQGRVYPAWDGRTLDVGPALLRESIACAAGPNVDADDVEDRLADLGEIGAVAAAYDFGGQQGLSAFGGGTAGSLTVAEVDERLREVAAADGEGSQERRIETLFGLFNRASPEEATFLARLVLGTMRIGVGEGTVRDAIAAAFIEPLPDEEVVDDDGAADEVGEGTADPATDGTADAGAEGTADAESADDAADTDDCSATAPSEAAVAAVERALQVSNDYGRVAVVAREEGRAGLDAMGLDVGRPVQTMLAQAGTAADGIDAWGEAIVGTKFDGARVQVHYDGTEPRIFSRNMEDVTDPLPEVVEFVERELDVPVVLDGEVVAVDDDGAPLPFQEVLRRFRRKHDVERMREEVRVELRAFDCLHADGTDLLDAPLLDRRDRLDDLLGDTDVVEEVVRTTDPDAVAAAERTALEAGHEGVMLKDPDSAYEPGKRGRNWLKRKPDVETLDLVVTGAEWGEGRRANLLGTFLLSARVEDAAPIDGANTGDDGAYATIGKVATGITDAKLESLTDLLEPHVDREDGQAVSIEPAVVFEVGYEGIQPSPTYESGYALRFPRFVGVRSDNSPGDADTVARVERLADEQ
ncbi:ATP-dependent DNA ligase LigA [Halobellus ruber]|uniref:DNA ligase n=1 Tax=Halobellus ruber TaxID=2761102 RepID=A0A7J9SKF4_9EURY|nr:ATP-dependent DNA ligase LigA [Halobellus ruber]MBB6645501.1 ATP-dependent DNA ligase [Halobellus ruber]